MSERCDVLIVGGGGAALRAAIAAHEFDPALDVTLVTKGALGHSGVTATACSDRMAFHATLPGTEPGGAAAWKYHAADIYRIGGYVSDADLAETLARDAGAALYYLDRLGVPWVRRADGSIDQFVTDGSLYARACYTGPHTANHIEEALVRRVRELPVRILENQLVAELLLDDSRERVLGAALLSQRDDNVTAISTKAVILATGGAGQVFAVNVFPPDCTGDGYAMAYRAGAELVNLEFIQIGLSSLETKLACSGSMMRALPRLVDERGQEFLSRYVNKPPAKTYAILFAKGASWPVSYREPSHIIDLAVAAEIAQGRRVFLDYARNPNGLVLGDLPKHVLTWYADRGLSTEGDQMATPLSRLLAINQPSVQWLAERGIDLPAGDRVEIAPAIQHFQGGIKIRTHGETTVAGLYAAGETAGGQHGANRPGGNALLDSQVFGRIAGEAAARLARATTFPDGDLDKRARQAIGALFAPSGVAASTARREITAAMTRACGVYRTPKGLRDLAANLGHLANRGLSHGGAPLHEAVEAVNVLQVAQMVAVAALKRDESRGPHLRFPDDGSLKPLPRNDERWCVYNVLRRGPDGPIIERRAPVVPQE